MDEEKEKSLEDYKKENEQMLQDLINIQKDVTRQEEIQMLSNENIFRYTLLTTLSSMNQNLSLLNQMMQTLSKQLSQTLIKPQRV